MSALPSDKCLIGMGGNVGDVRQTFRAALPILRAALQSSHIRVSRFYETAPMGNSTEAIYGNAVVQAQTPLDSHGILDQLLYIESRLGRIRHETWGPRTLDLDLLCHGSRICHTDRLILPHPGCWFRRFVLDPLCELASSVNHPVWKITFQQLRHRLLARPLSVAILGADADFTKEIQLWGRMEFPGINFQFESAETVVASGLLIVVGSVASMRNLPSNIPMIALDDRDVIRDRQYSRIERLRFAVQAAIDQPEPRDLLI